MKIRYLTLAVAFATSHVVAQTELTDEDSEIEHITISSRVPVPVREVATSVTVLTKEQIEAIGSPNLAEVLQTQPAIYVNKTGSIGSTTALRIRGEEGYRTLVRIDGIDISDPATTQIQPQLANFMSTHVSRVEILRGTQGLVYGADAGGVINVQTGQAHQGTFGSAMLEGGQFSTTNLAAEVGGDYDKANFYLSAADFSTEGFNSRTDDTSKDEDGYDNTSVHAKLGYQLSDTVSVALVGHTTSGDSEYDNCGWGSSASNDCSSEYGQDNLRVSTNYNGDLGSHQLSYAKSFVERDYLNQGVSSYFTKGTIERVEYVASNQLSKNTALVYGFDWEEQAITSANQSRIEKGYYVEVQGEWTENWFTTLGLRHDDNEDFGEHTSYRLSSAYIFDLASGELKIRGALGTGFRAPSIYEVEYNRGPYAYSPASDTALTEELSSGYELGVQYKLTNGAQLEAVYFDQKIEDAITFDLASYSGYIQEEGTSYSSGVELIADLPIATVWWLTANYTYNDTEDTEGDQRSRRPRHLLNVALSYRIEQLSVNAGLRAVSDFVDNGTEMEDYQLINISAKYSFNDDLHILARIENLLDEEYQEVTSYNTAGTNGYIGVKYQF